MNPSGKMCQTRFFGAGFVMFDDGFFFVMADSYICHGALFENDESAQRVKESSRRRNQSAIKKNESGGKNVGN